jgi:hypothetical protein
MRVNNDMHLKNDTQITNERRIDSEMQIESGPRSESRASPAFTLRKTESAGSNLSFHPALKAAMKPIRKTRR